MEFGRVPKKDLLKVNFKLPPEPQENTRVLNGKPSKVFKVYTGCAKWGIKEWKGSLYPKKMPDRLFLDEYVKHYNSIELNATHYKINKPEQIAGWAAKANGLDFKFCPKFYKGISHFGSLSDKKHLTDNFFESLSPFGPHLGPLFLQVSDRFSPKRKAELFNYLESLPRDTSFFLEVRHPDWFQLSERLELIKVLKKLKIGLVITDTASRRDCCHMHLTVPSTFIRYVGNSLHPTDYKRIDSWIKRIKYWQEHGLKELYFFMHMHDEARSPELTQYLIMKLNKACKLNLLMPMSKSNDHA